MSENQNIAIFIAHDANLSNPQIAAQVNAQIEAISCGIEEEGLPFIIIAPTINQHHLLAEAASQQSQLDVGIGLNNSNQICIHHAKFPENFVIFDEILPSQDFFESAKNLGANAARLVKGLPFKHIKI